MLGGKTGVCAGRMLRAGADDRRTERPVSGKPDLRRAAGGAASGKAAAAGEPGYLLASLAAAYLSALNFYPPLFFATAVGALAFSLLPERALRRLSRLVRKLVCSRSQENAYTRLRMQRWVRAIDSIAAALPHPQPPAAEETGESEAVGERLCQECDRLPICWRDQYEQTKAGMEALARRETGDDGYLDVINRYFSACTRISRIPAFWRNWMKKAAGYAARSVRGLRTGYAANASDGAFPGGAAYQPGGRAGRRGGKRMAGTGGGGAAKPTLPRRAAFVKKVDGRMLICLQYEPLALRPTANDGLARHIGVRLGLKLQVTEQSGWAHPAGGGAAIAHSHRHGHCLCRIARA